MGTALRVNLIDGTSWRASFLQDAIPKLIPFISCLAKASRHAYHWAHNWCWIATAFTASWATVFVFFIDTTSQCHFLNCLLNKEKVIFNLRKNLHETNPKMNKNFNSSSIFRLTRSSFCWVLNFATASCDQSDPIFFDTSTITNNKLFTFLNSWIAFALSGSLPTSWNHRNLL